MYLVVDSLVLALVRLLYNCLVRFDSWRQLMDGILSPAGDWPILLDKVCSRPNLLLTILLMWLWILFSAVGVEMET